MQTASLRAALLRARHGTHLSAPALGTGLHRGTAVAPQGLATPRHRPAPRMLAGAAGWQRDEHRDLLLTLGDSALGTWVLALPHGEAWGGSCQKMASSSSSLLDG